MSFVMTLDLQRCRVLGEVGEDIFGPAIADQTTQQLGFSIGGQILPQELARMLVTERDRREPACSSYAFVFVKSTDEAVR